MMYSNEYQDELEALSDEKWADKVAKKVHRVPGEKRAEFRQAIDPTTTSFRNAQSTRAWADSLVEMFSTMSDQDVQKLMNTMFPQMGTHIFEAWRTSSNRPYQGSTSRFGFPQSNS